jgi:hypothetical protein
LLLLIFAQPFRRLLAGWREDRRLGFPFGAQRPYHAETWSPFQPTSSTAETSGATGSRCDAMTAYWRMCALHASADVPAVERSTSSEMFAGHRAVERRHAAAMRHDAQ